MRLLRNGTQAPQPAVTLGDGLHLDAGLRRRDEQGQPLRSVVDSDRRCLPASFRAVALAAFRRILERRQVGRSEQRSSPPTAKFCIANVGTNLLRGVKGRGGGGLGGRSADSLASQPHSLVSIKSASDVVNAARWNIALEKISNDEDP
jgi:hypothetical protein